MVRKLSYLICFVFVVMLFMPANAPAWVLTVPPPGITEDFQPYALGQVDAVTGGQWVGMGVGNPYAVVKADPAVGGNQVLGLSNIAGVSPPAPSGVYSPLGVAGSITPGDTREMTLRFNVPSMGYSATGYVNQSFGLTDVDAPVNGGDFSLFGVQIGLGVGFAGAPAGTLNMKSQFGAGGSYLTMALGASNPIAWQLTPGKWYSLWVDVTNNTAITDTYTMYVQGDGSDANNPGVKTQLYNRNTVTNVFNFRKTLSATLDTFIWKAQASTTLLNPEVLMDDITIPEPATMILLGLGSLALLKRRKS